MATYRHSVNPKAAGSGCQRVARAHNALPCKRLPVLCLLSPKNTYQVLLDCETLFKILHKWQSKPEMEAAKCSHRLLYLVLPLCLQELDSVLS